jgi:glycerol-3-phosphate dehydrogenase
MTACEPAILQGRNDSLAALAGRVLDLLVAGGGIVGAGVARDAAMRGLGVGLVERNDFASGTSSRSSRLLHGGLRYLAQGRLGLVREASLEKRILHQIAPHLAQPLPFIFPSYRGSGWPLWQLRLGVRIYDLLCGGRNFGKSRGLDRAEAAVVVPGLRREGLTGAVRYYDALTNDARLVLDTLKSAARHDAAALNYCALREANREAGLWRCVVEDRLTGKALAVRSRTIVNATGPWAEGFLRSRVKLRLTKGVHIVIERRRLPVPEAVVVTEGKRILFVIPWGERVIIGTTDTDYHGTPADVQAESDDVAYLLQTVNEFFPEAALAEDNLVAAWAGVRPLIANPNGSPSEISRSHEIRQPEPGWWDVAGGKLTTYRLMAQQTVDQIVSCLGCRARPCRTALEPLLATPQPPSDQAQLCGASVQNQGPGGILPPPVTADVVRDFIVSEWAVHLDDVMLRRAGWASYHRKTGGLLGQVGQWMANVLGWTPDVLAQEMARCGQAVDVRRD